MLSFAKFNRLQDEEKCEFTFDQQHCTYLMSYWEGPTYSFNLYHATHAPAGAYFIEVKYNECYHCIEGFLTFKTAWACMRICRISTSPIFGPKCPSNADTQTFCE